MAVRLVAAARFKHDGRQLYRGVEFEATEQEAEELITLRFATRALSAQAPAIASAPGSSRSRRKNTYRRRDMRAES